MAVLSGKKAVFTKAKQCIRLAGDRRWLHKATTIILSFVARRHPADGMILLLPRVAGKIVALLVASYFDRDQWQFVDCTC